jgi:TRAP-type C4-dicarboxylate transport system substrate-binding protein
MMRKNYLIIAILALFISGAGYFVPATHASESKPIVLKAAHFVPERSFVGQQNIWWANELEKRTNGRVKVKFYWMQSLIKFKDMLPALKSGIADITSVGSTFFPSNFPLYMVIDSPGNLKQDYGAAILALLDTIENQADLRAELDREKVVLVAPYLSGLGQIGLKTCPGSLADIKGKTIRSYGGGVNRYIKNLGANPVFMPYTQVYEAIDRGTIDGSMLAVSLSNAFKHYEVMKCVYIVDLSTALAAGLHMNRDRFQGLPKDIQKTILELRKESGLRFARDLKNLEEKVYVDWVMKHNVTLKALTPEESKVSIKAREEARKYMIKKQESEGHKAARKVWDYYSEALQKYTAERAR